MKILLTGMTGFAGSYVAEEILAETDWEIYSLERKTVRPNMLGCLTHSPRIKRLYHDFRSPLPERILEELSGVDFIVHLGAEVHGLRSLENPELFIHSNVMGTFHMLEAARKLRAKKFVYISSAETVGSASSPQSYAEDCPLRPSNPYSASKAAGEVLSLSYKASFQVPSVVVRTMNIFGERQDISKFVPGVISKVFKGEVISIHVDGNGSTGSRQWLHVREFAKAVLFLATQGIAGETYHVVGPEKNNLEIVSLISRFLHIPVRLQSVIPGKSHDMRYSIKDTKVPVGTYQQSSESFEKSIADTTLFYQENREWLR